MRFGVTFFHFFCQFLGRFPIFWPFFLIFAFRPVCHSIPGPPGSQLAGHPGAHEIAKPLLRFWYGLSKWGCDKQGSGGVSPPYLEISLFRSFAPFPTFSPFCWRARTAPGKSTKHKRKAFCLGIALNPHCSEPPQKSRKIGAARTLSKSVEKYFWRFSPFLPCAKNVEK